MSTQGNKSMRSIRCYRQIPLDIRSHECHTYESRGLQMDQHLGSKQRSLSSAMPPKPWPDNCEEPCFGITSLVHQRRSRYGSEEN
jgi:hypothetical protein